MSKDFKIGFLFGSLIFGGAALSGGFLLGADHVKQQIRAQVAKGATLAAETTWRVIETARNGALTREEFEQEIHDVFNFLSIVQDI